MRVMLFYQGQVEILKDESAQTTARVVSVAYGLWLPFLTNSAQFNKFKERDIRNSCQQHASISNAIAQYCLIIFVIPKPKASAPLIISWNCLS